MKSIAKGLLVALLLPVFTYSQVFKVPEFSYHQDEALLAKQIMKHSPLMEKLNAIATVHTDMKPEEARALVRKKLNELNNEELNKAYAKLDEESTTQIGVALYLLMNGLSNTDDGPGVDSKTAFGGGLGVYMMMTMANIILMPELAFWLRPLKAEYGNTTFKDRYSYLTFAFTAMYIIRMTTLNFLLGISPNLGYALSGRSKQDDEDWEDIEFGDDRTKRTHFALGITAGIMLQNAMVIRLMYNLGLSKLQNNSDAKMYAIMLALHIPIWRM